jgi:hypothetical protein
MGGRKNDRHRSMAMASTVSDMGHEEKTTMKRELAVAAIQEARGREQFARHSPRDVQP